MWEHNELESIVLRDVLAREFREKEVSEEELNNLGFKDYHCYFMGYHIFGNENERILCEEKNNKYTLYMRYTV